MTSSYFELADDVEIHDRWFLKSPRDADGEELNPEMFRVGKPVQVKSPVRISVRRAGRRLDFTFADSEMPVASAKATEVLSGLVCDEIQLIPAEVDGGPESYSIVNVLHSMDCLDEKRSEFIKWRKEDLRLDKVGQYRQVTRLLIDASRTAGKKIFRIEGWRICVVVTEEVRQAFINHGITGAHFLGVS